MSISGHLRRRLQSRWGLLSISGSKKSITKQILSSIINLTFDGFGINLNALRGEFNAYRRLWFQVELISRKSGKKITFSDSGITN